MSVLIVGDLHVDIPKEYRYITDDGSPSNYVLDACKKGFEYLARFIERNDIREVFFLGDMMTLKDRIPNVVKNTLSEGLSLLKVPVYVIEGNHDNANESSSLKLFNVSIISKTSLVTTTQGKVLCIPYNDPNFDMKDCLVLTHQPISGVKVNNIKIMDGVNPSSFKGSKQVICGHYHSFQKIGENITCLGSFYQTTWAETDQKYIAVYKNDKVSYIRLPFFINRVNIDLQNEGQELPYPQGDGFDFARIKTSLTDVKYLNDVKRQLQERGFHYVTIEYQMFERELPAMRYSKPDEFKRFAIRKLHTVNYKVRHIYRKILEEVS